MRVLNSRQMRDADRRTIEDVGIPSIVLMENAGRQVVAAMESTFESLSVMSVAVLCGRGNNGGDGFVVARTLIERDIDVAVYLFAASAEVRGDARINLDVCATSASTSSRSQTRRRGSCTAGKCSRRTSSSMPSSARG